MSRQNSLKISAMSMLALKEDRRPTLDAVDLQYLLDYLDPFGMSRSRQSSTGDKPFTSSSRRQSSLHMLQGLLSSSPLPSSAGPRRQPSFLRASFLLKQRATQHQTSALLTDSIFMSYDQNSHSQLYEPLPMKPPTMNLPLPTTFSPHARPSPSNAPFSTPEKSSSNTHIVSRGSREPTEYDVVCGRGKGSYNRAGNRRLRVIIRKHLEEYLHSDNKVYKSAIIAKIIRQVKIQDEGRANFLKKDKTGAWIELAEKTTREKVGHAIREVMASTKSQGSSSVSSKTATSASSLNVKKRPRKVVPSAELPRVFHFLPERIPSTMASATAMIMEEV